MTVELHDAQGALLHAAGDALVYLHGGHGGLPEALEQALEGKSEGELVRVHLEPEQAFGDYDPELLRVEPRSRYGEGIEVGMEVEDAFDGGAPQLYLVTDVAENKVVLDANHPLAGHGARVHLPRAGGARREPGRDRARRAGPAAVARFRTARRRPRCRWRR